MRNFSRSKGWRIGALSFTPIWTLGWKGGCPDRARPLGRGDFDAPGSKPTNQSPKCAKIPVTKAKYIRILLQRMPMQPTHVARWRRWCAFLSLFAFLTTAVIHAGHISQENGYTPNPQVSSPSGAGSICPTCIALHASQAQARFQTGVLELMVRRAPAMARESAGTPPRISRLFVRPPPAS